MTITNRGPHMHTAAPWQCRISSARTCILNINKQTTITFPVVLYGCDTWFLTFKDTDTGCSTTGEKEPNISRTSSLAEIDSNILCSQSTVQNICSWYSVTKYSLLSTPRRRFRDNTETDLEQTLRVGFSWLIAGWTHEDSSVVVASVRTNKSHRQVLHNDCTLYCPYDIALGHE